MGYRSNLSDSTKLTYLKTYLRGYALKIVQHLHVTNGNYLIAIELLEREFLNVDSLTDELFKKLLQLSPHIDNNFLETKVYISEIRCILTDLKVYGCDILGEIYGTKLVSHIVFSKLPKMFR